MADLHEQILRSFRRNVRRGFKEAKSAMPTFRPDFFAARTSSLGTVREQIAVEAEIQSTIFLEHTSHQLVLMQEFIEHQRAKRVRVKGYLLIPNGQQVRRLAESLLESLFPFGTSIRILQK